MDRNKESCPTPFRTLRRLFSALRSVDSIVCEEANLGLWPAHPYVYRNCNDLSVMIFLFFRTAIRRSLTDGLTASLAHCAPAARVNMIATGQNSERRNKIQYVQRSLAFTGRGREGGNDLFPFLRSFPYPGLNLSSSRLPTKLFATGTG
jgi:hypothetical protein